jgi:Cdc6-like AAA superfamily ATPase
MAVRASKKQEIASNRMTDDQKQTLSMLSPISVVKPGIIVPRTNLPEQLQTEIMPAEPVKLFVAGQRGMGKTTELKRFVEMLKDTEFLAVFLQFGSQESINHAGLIRAMAAGLYGTENSVVDDKSYEKLQEWYDAEESSSLVEERSGGKASLGGSYVFIGASGEISHAKTKSTKKTRRVEKNIVQLVERFNSFVEKTAKATKKRIVFVVDDIDKVQDSDRYSRCVDFERT